MVNSETEIFCVMYLRRTMHQDMHGQWWNQLLKCWRWGWSRSRILSCRLQGLQPLAGLRSGKLQSCRSLLFRYSPCAYYLYSWCMPTSSITIPAPTMHVSLSDHRTTHWYPSSYVAYTNSIFDQCMILGHERHYIAFLIILSTGDRALKFFNRPLPHFVKSNQPTLPSIPRLSTGPVIFEVSWTCKNKIWKKWSQIGYNVFKQ